MSATFSTLLRSAYPILPWFSPRLWGTLDLCAYYPQRGREPEPIGEAWLTADHCQVADLPGLNLAALLREAPGHLLSSSRQPFDSFPVLVKYLFPKDRLSVQVHPDDAYAAANGMGRGKTEMWYVVSAAPGAQLGVGLVPGATLRDFEAACRSGRGAEILDWFDVHPGEAIFLPAGSIHAIGPDVVLCEVQQQSDNTFRLDDYGRRDARGNLRELHLDHGLAVARPGLGGRIEHGLGAGESGLLVECEYFRVERLVHHGSQPMVLPSGDLIILANLGDEVQLVQPDHPREVQRLAPAHAVVLPALAQPWSIVNDAELLLITLP